FDSDPSQGGGANGFIAPPLTDAGGAEPGARQGIFGAAVRAAWDNSFEQRGQPLEHAHPELRAEQCNDPEFVRRADIDRILRSDVVVIVATRRASGLGTVATWAERTGALILVLVDPKIGASPLAFHRSTTTCIRPLIESNVQEVVSAFVSENSAAIESHRAHRSRRNETYGGEFRRFREAFIKEGRQRVAEMLPPWLPVERAIELLRTVDHFAVMTNDEY